MKIKLDENLGKQGLELLRQHGHDVMSVREQAVDIGCSAFRYLR